MGRYLSRGLGPISDQIVHDALVLLITATVGGYALWYLISRLSRGRPGFAVGWAAVVGLAIRVLVAGGVSLTGVGATLRGGDGLTFLTQSHQILATPFGGGSWISALTGKLYEFIF